MCTRQSTDDLCKSDKNWVNIKNGEGKKRYCKSKNGTDPKNDVNVKSVNDGIWGQ